MESRSKISEELNAISTLLAGIKPVNPYSISQDYFEHFPVRMLQLVSFPADLDKSSEAIPLKPDTSSPYTVPPGYFESLSHQILNKVHQQQVDDIREELLNVAPILADASKQMPYSIPENYFSVFASGIIQAAAQKEDHGEESVVLKGISTKMPYSIPEDYFEELPALITKKLPVTGNGKLVAMKGVSKFFRYAAAALIAGALITGAIFYINRKPSEGIAGTVKSIQQVPSEELENYIENQFNTFDYTDSSLSTAASDLGEEDLKIMLEDIPDAALQQYLTLYTDPKTNTN